MSDKKNRNRFLLELKYKIVKIIGKNTLFNEIQSEFSESGLKIKNINDLKYQSSNIFKGFESLTSSNVKSVRKNVYPKVEEDLVKFISESNSKGLPINTLILKEKAIQLAEQRGIEKFNASNGWISKFKIRNEITFKTIHGEADGVPDQLYDD